MERGAEVPPPARPPPLTVALLARRPQAAVQAGSPAQAAGRDLAGGLVPLPQDVQAAQRAAPRRRHGRAWPRCRP